eukprot:tig00020564_g11454.t1
MYEDLLRLCPESPPKDRARWMRCAADLFTRMGMPNEAMELCKKGLTLLGRSVPKSKLGLWAGLRWSTLKVVTSRAPTATDGYSKLRVIDIDGKGASHPDAPEAGRLLRKWRERATRMQSRTVVVRVGLSFNQLVSRSSLRAMSPDGKFGFADVLLPILRANRGDLRDRLLDELHETLLWAYGPAARAWDHRTVGRVAADALLGFTTTGVHQNVSADAYAGVSFGGLVALYVSLVYTVAADAVRYAVFKPSPLALVANFLLPAVAPAHAAPSSSPALVPGAGQRRAAPRARSAPPAPASFPGPHAGAGASTPFHANAHSPSTSAPLVVRRPDPTDAELREALVVGGRYMQRCLTREVVRPLHSIAGGLVRAAQDNVQGATRLFAQAAREARAGAHGRDEAMALFLQAVHTHAAPERAALAEAARAASEAAGDRFFARVSAQLEAATFRGRGSGLAKLNIGGGGGPKIEPRAPAGL